MWIAATYLADHHGWAPRDAAERLQCAGGLLDGLGIGDVSVRHRLRSAYRPLDPPARRAFRRLGLSTDGEIDAAHMACLLGVSKCAAEPMLEALVDAGLLQVSHTAGAYHIPVLFAFFARELLNKKEPATARRPNHLAAAPPITKRGLACH